MVKRTAASADLSSKPSSESFCSFTRASSSDSVPEDEDPAKWKYSVPPLAPGVPGPRTPSDSPDPEEEDDLFLISLASCALTQTQAYDAPDVLDLDLDMDSDEEEISEEQEALRQQRSPKSNKVRKISISSPVTSNGNSSEASTALPTPTSTPATSPVLGPVGFPAQPKVDYSKLSVPDLRAILGVEGLDIAEGWEQAELAAVLEEMDKVCLPNMADLHL
eukprot:TRINITY_DN49412_c0_g1_i1.p1 TRINITY_DN49412_c0_g1~~TRINITY_DN49412_c0_g1_i1.p1  ORF type:complete len:220 (+),score=49.29 TRINITY_DN49412_c0_g1_i1:50-709(+)